MAVAENPVAKTTPSRPSSPEAGLGLSSLAGGIVILAGLFFVFGGLPYIWHEQLLTAGRVNEFLSGALLLIVGLVAIVAVGFLWYKLDRVFDLPGLRAGSFVAAFFLFVAASIVIALGNGVFSLQGNVGAVMTVVFGGLFLAGIAFLFTRPFFTRWLVSLEDNGWFTLTPFKGNQGVRVRRATVAGLLVIGFTGIITMVNHGAFGSTRDSAWDWRIPFTSNGEYYLSIPLIARLNVIGPILLGVIVFWFSWRLVNWPTFADFLIATEAEMNKVSWTSRKRLFTDTIVVLVTVFLLTAFLFTVDIVWFRVLSSDIVNVLHVDLKREQAKQQEKTQW